MDATLRQLERKATSLGASPVDIAAYNTALLRANQVLCIGVFKKETVHAYHPDDLFEHRAAGQIAACRGLNNYNYYSVTHGLPTCKLCLRALQKGRKLAQIVLTPYTRRMFEANRCAVVDRQGTSILIRGNMPLIDNHYAYDEIASAVNQDLTSFDQFISVSLIDNTGERDIWSSELRAFGINPYDYPASIWPPYQHLRDKWKPGQKLGTQLNGSVSGSLIWWPIEGLSATEPYPQTFLQSPGWDLSGLVDRIHELLQEPKTAIYFHCMLGADRTGAVHASYLVKYLNKSIDDALQITTNATAAGAPTMDYQRLARAYAANR